MTAPDFNSASLPRVMRPVRDMGKRGVRAGGAW